MYFLWNTVSQSRPVLCSFPEVDFEIPELPGVPDLKMLEPQPSESGKENLARTTSSSSLCSSSTTSHPSLCKTIRYHTQRRNRNETLSTVINKGI